MVHLPEHCLFCKRELNPFELVVVLDTGEEKRAGSMTFGESAEGVRCGDCAPEGNPKASNGARNPAPP